MDSESDEKLMEMVQGGDAQAFSALVARHAPRFYGTAWRIVQSREEAEDVVQEAFTRLWEDPFLWEDGRGARFATWFTRLVVNRAIDTLRRRRRFVSDGTVALDLAPDPAPGVDAVLIDGERRQALERAIANLAPNQKAAIALCYGEGMSGREAAESLGVGIKALESLLSRAKDSLRRTLAREDEGNERNVAARIAARERSRDNG